MSRTLWVAFALFIVYGTTIPFRFVTDGNAVAEKLAHISLNPLVRAETGQRVSITDTVQNVMLFLPFGALGAYALRTRVRSTGARIVIVGTAGAALSVLVESFQLFTVDRVASLSDVVTNTTGALLGAAVAEQSRQWALAGLQRLSRAGFVETVTFYPAMIAAAVVIAAAWQPFDLTLDVSSVGRSLRAVWRDPWQVGTFRDEGAAVIHYALFTIAWCAWLDRLRVPRATMVATTFGLLTALGLEASQIVVDSRMPSGLDAAVRVAAVVTGAFVWIVARRSRLAGGWLVLLGAVTAIGVALQMLSPFEFASVRRPFGWIPFAGYYQNNWFPSVSHLIELVLLYFPLGFCIGLAKRDRRLAMWLTVAIVLGIALPVEYFQGWVVGRFPDITDVAVSVAGGWFGVFASHDGARAFQQTIASVARVTRIASRRSA